MHMNPGNWTQPVSYTDGGSPNCTYYLLKNNYIRTLLGQSHEILPFIKYLNSVFYKSQRSCGHFFFHQADLTVPLDAEQPFTTRCQCCDTYKTVSECLLDSSSYENHHLFYCLPICYFIFASSSLSSFIFYSPAFFCSHLFNFSPLLSSYTLHCPSIFSSSPPICSAFTSLLRFCFLLLVLLPSPSPFLELGVSFSSLSLF